VPDLVYIYDLTTGKNLYVNPSVTALLGYSAEELREIVNHLSLEGILHEEDRETYLSRHQHIDGCADGTLIDGVYRLKHRDGHWVWVESRETVFARNAAGQATQVFGVMQDATLRKQAETEMVEAAAADERQRLARELHDSVTQTLFSASMVAQSLPWLWGKGESVVKQNLEELSRLTRGALAEMRTLLNELRPSAIATADLTELLTHLLDAARGRTSAEFTLTCEGESNLPPEVKVAVYRIAQEALNNVTKHARAKHVQLQLRRNAGGVEMRIVDDGRGFSQELPMSDHFGLGIMQERAEEIGATLIVESRPGHGTEVGLVWQRSETSPVEIQEAQR
jgi:PAS domain S-box-containing protein